MRKLIVSPSLLACDYLNMGAELKTVEHSGSEYAHVDIMDGIFVPNLSFGLPLVEHLRRGTDLTLDVHLMIDRPVRYVERFCKSGSDIVTIHAEADTVENNRKALEMIKAAGVRPGLSIKPKTPAEAVIPYLDLCSLILVMTVEPGFGGQSFMEDMMPKITKIKQMIDEKGIDCDIEVDGGINVETAHTCVTFGANVLVAGSAFFKAKNKKDFVDSIILR